MSLKCKLVKLLYKSFHSISSVVRFLLRLEFCPSFFCFTTNSTMSVYKVMFM